MSRNLINLLPVSRIRTFRRAYFYRLGTLALVLIAVAIAIHAILLLPSYLYLGAEQEAREKESARLGAELAASTGGVASAELMRLEAEAKYLARLGTLPSASAAVRNVLAAPRADIRIGGLTFTPPTGAAANGKMTIIGIARTREALRTYATTLASVPGVTAVDLPIGAYAKEADINFSLTLTGGFVSP